MVFRGCDRDFGEAMDAARKNPVGFSMFVKSYVAAMERTREEREEKARHAREEYGVGCCPFHGSGEEYLVGFKPDSFTLRLGDRKYKFHEVDCGQLRFCDSIISFDEELVGELAKCNLKRVVSPDPPGRTACPACGSQKGKIYDTGVRIPNLHQVVIAPEPLYLFDRPCHTYAAATNEGVLLYPITRNRSKNEEVRIVMLGEV